MRSLIGALGLIMSLGGFTAALADGLSTVEQARLLAHDGQRKESLALLRERLRVVPDDGDALVLMGTVLSWEGKYDEARANLDQVLRRNPVHYDALRASINLELWSDHPARAEELARAGLARDPYSPDLMLARARALRTMGRQEDAERVTAELLRLEPENQAGLGLLERLAEQRRIWEIALRYSYDGFDDGRDDWNEGVLAIKRRFGFGRVALRYYHSRHFGYDGDQIEIQSFPGLRDGTYIDVAFAVSPQGENYPYWRVQLDLYQSILGGLEASIGYRHLQFSSGVNILALTLTKYLGGWMLVGRSFITPGDGGVSVSAHAAVRRYFRNDTSYVAMRYSHGLSREEIRTADDVATLSSNSVGWELDLGLGRWSLNLNASYGYGERHERSDLGNWSLGAGTAFRF